MTKAEAYKIADEALTEYMKAAGDLIRDDIMLKVYLFENDEGEDAKIEGMLTSDSSHRKHQLSIYVKPDTTKDELLDIVRHEVMHIYTAEYKYFYDFYHSNMDGEIDVSEISWKLFEQIHETVAPRLARAMIYFSKDNKRGKNG